MAADDVQTSVDGFLDDDLGEVDPTPMFGRADEAVDAFRKSGLSVTLGNGITIGNFDGISTAGQLDVSEVGDDDLRGIYDDVISGDVVTWDCVDSAVMDKLLERRDVYTDIMSLDEDVLDGRLNGKTSIEVVDMAEGFAKDMSMAVPTWFRSKYGAEPVPRQAAVQQVASVQPAANAAVEAKSQYGSAGRRSVASNQQLAGRKINASQAIGGLRSEAFIDSSGKKFPSAFHKRGDKLAVTVPVILDDRRTNATVLVQKGADALVIKDRRMAGRECLMLEPDRMYNVEVGYPAGSVPSGYPEVGQSKDGTRVYVGMSISGHDFKLAHDAFMARPAQKQVEVQSETDGMYPAYSPSGGDSKNENGVGFEA